MKIIEIPDNKIIFNLHSIEVKSGINLTLTNKLAYLKLLHYAEENGHYDDDEKMYYVDDFITELSQKLNINKRTLHLSLDRLVECGVIKKQTIDKSKLKVKKTRAKRIYFNLDIFTENFQL